MNIKIVTLISCLSIGSLFSQEVLTKDAAVDIALENNYGIKRAVNTERIAENNASIYNSNYLPSVSANAGATYNNRETEFTREDGDTNVNKGESENLNASISLNYTLFDGMGRKYNYKQLKERHNLSELETRTVIENTLLDIFTVYYEVARLTTEKENIGESLEISKQRMQRAEYAFDYGQSTKLQLLNAEVDMNNDSIRYINTERLLTNAKRDLNLLLGREITTEYVVDTDVDFELFFNEAQLLDKAKAQNVEMQKIDANELIADYGIKISKSGLYPRLNFNTAYSFNETRNNNPNNLAFINKLQTTEGYNVGVSLNWNIFDGGTTKTRIANAKIAAENIQVAKAETLSQLERNVINALNVYNNALFILQAEETNVATNQLNFERTEEQYKLGQINSIEFRQAQVNLLNAQSNLNTAKFAAKNAELFLLQVSGQLLDYNF